jgi:hypothetical protein
MMYIFLHKESKNFLWREIYIVKQSGAVHTAYNVVCIIEVTSDASLQWIGFKTIQLDKFYLWII